MISTAHQRLKIGDVFRVPVDGSTNGHFQYVATDTTQLSSEVIRVFQEAHSTQDVVDIENIVRGVVAFYAHVFLKIGLKQKYWHKVGHSDEIGQVDVLFRNSNDYGNPKIRVSHDWHVWRINEPFEKVGNLSADYQDAEIGVVVPPDSLVHRIRSGRYDFVYPDY